MWLSFNMWKMIILKQLFIECCRMVKVCVDCFICIALSIVLQREPREASKLINVAHN